MKLYPHDALVDYYHPNGNISVVRVVDAAYDPGTDQWLYHVERATGEGTVKKWINVPERNLEPIL